MSYVLLDDQGTGKQMVFRAPSAVIFRAPSAVITATGRENLPKAFAQIEAAQRDGKWLAGWLSYDLGHALEPRFASADTNAPLMRLGIFDAPVDHPPADWLYTRNVPQLEFQPSCSSRVA